VSPQRLLVIRAIDDEASLTLALGTILNYLTARLITYVFLLFLGVPAILIGVAKSSLPDWFAAATVAGCIVLTIMLLGMFVVSRLVHGRELARSPMECQINTQSTPDVDGLSKIVTLVRRTYVKALRHGIYDHEDCAKTISDWVRSQLFAMPTR
jgi:membrane protein implicated in regulation of membrane protease activity